MKLAPFFLTALMVLTACSAAAERFALVIGNGGYETASLANPPNDAALTTAALRDAGFAVTTVVDANQIEMKQRIRAFSQTVRSAGPDAVAAFYYAGHGVQVDGKNYLIPVDATISAKPDLEYETIEAQWVLDMIGASGAGLSIIILDACRDDPFRSFTRSHTRGLARMDAPRGALLSYSTAPGDVAADGAANNSPFTEALARAIRTPGLKIEETFKQVRREVLDATGDRQLPWESTSLTGDFYFTPGGQSLPVATVVTPEPATPAPQPEPAAQVAAAPATSVVRGFVPVKLSMDDWDQNRELRCYHPETRKVATFAPVASSRCRGGYYRISESDYFKVQK